MDNQKCENYFDYEVTERINFIGFIDKLMYKELDDEIIASVVDYKTNKNIEIDKDIMKYGLSLQLPSYLYLIKHSKDFTKEVKMEMPNPAPSSGNCDIANTWSIPKQ